MASTDRLAGKVAVITGGSNGIGAAAVRQFAALGASCIIGYHESETRARDLMAALPGAGHDVAQLALEDERSFEALAKRLQPKFGKIDVLVNSAGFTQAIAHHDFDTMSVETFERILIANVVGPYTAIRALHPLLKASGEAVVVNVSSVSAFTASGSNIAYCAAKAALDNMTMSLGRALGPDIRVMSVAPGAVATGFVPGRDRSALEVGAKATPLRRVVEPDDVADAIVACVTHLRSSTGGRIVVDGGKHL